MEKDPKIFVAGHKGMVGSAVVRALNEQGHSNIIVRSHAELDLINQQSVETFFQLEKPDYVVLAAAKVGGIHANSSYPADFIYQNLMIESNIIHQSYRSKVTRLMFLGSSCIYPKFADQPIKEAALLTGELESTNEPYAIAKIAGIKLCESYNRQYGTDFRSLMPTNLYGSNDNYDLQNSHVIPALIRKIHNAKTKNLDHVDVWGTGVARREFLYVDDLAVACVSLMAIKQSEYWRIVSSKNSHINVGTGVDVSIKELVALLVEVIGYTGQLRWDHSKPDGTPRKLLNVNKAAELGWQATTKLKDGLALTYQAYLNEQS